MTAPAGWASLALDASGPTWISVLECDGTEAALLATDEPQADMYLAGGRYLVFATASTADGPTTRVTEQGLPGAPAAPKRGSPPGLLGRGTGPTWRCSGSDPRIGAARADPS